MSKRKISPLSEISKERAFFSSSIRNVDHETGKTKSNFYDTAQGHAFYRSNGPDGYNFHENYRQGFRDYSSNQKPVAEGVNAHGNEFKFYENGSYRYK